MRVKSKVNSQLVIGWLITVDQSWFCFTFMITLLAPNSLHSFRAELPSRVPWRAPGGLDSNCFRHWGCQRNPGGSSPQLVAPVWAASFVHPQWGIEISFWALLRDLLWIYLFIEHFLFLKKFPKFLFWKILNLQKRCKTSTMNLGTPTKNPSPGFTSCSYFLHFFHIHVFS